MALCGSMFGPVGLSVSAAVEARLIAAAGDPVAEEIGRFELPEPFHWSIDIWERLNLEELPAGVPRPAVPQGNVNFPGG
jgi:hypothetical protein